MNRRRLLVLVTGRDPRRFLICSHSHYVRAHGYAATRAGYEVHVVCLGPESETQVTAYGVVHAFQVHSRYVRQNMIPMLAPTMVAGIVQLVARSGADRIILHGFGVWGYSVAKAAQKLRSARRRCAQVIGSYTTYLDESLSQWRGLNPSAGVANYAKFAFEQAWIRAVICRYEKEAYEAADVVLVNYASVAQLIKSRFDLHVPCEIIPYTTEHDFLNAIGPRARHDNGAPLILSIARHDPRKGCDVLLRALHNLAKEGIVFRARMIGAGPLLESNRRLARRLGLGDRVEIMGRVDDVIPHLMEAGIFVLPSREEQSGSLALLEALSAGVACVASACDGIPEDVQDGYNGLLARPGCSDSLGGCLRTLLVDPSLRMHLGRMGRETFLKRFSATAFTESLDQVYQRMFGLLSQSDAPSSSTNSPR